jgi:hypothetical protein
MASVPQLGGGSEYASAPTTVIGKPQRAISHQGELTQGPAVCQTDRRRPLRADGTPRKGRQATRPATSSNLASLAGPATVAGGSPRLFSGLGCDVWFEGGQPCELGECGLLTVVSATRTLTLWVLGRNVVLWWLSLVGSARGRPVRLLPCARCVDRGGGA